MKEIRRFPRLETLHVKGHPEEFSMNDVHIGLWRLASGKKIGPRRMNLLCNWFNLPIITKEIAIQIIAQLKSGEKKIRIRFPRRKDGKKS